VEEEKAPAKLAKNVANGYQGKELCPMLRLINMLPEEIVQEFLEKIFFVEERNLRAMYILENEYRRLKTKNGGNMKVGKKLAEYLQKERTSQNMTCKDVIKKTGLSYQTLLDLENSKKNYIKNGTIEKLKSCFPDVESYMGRKQHIVHHNKQPSDVVQALHQLTKKLDQFIKIGMRTTSFVDRRHGAQDRRQMDVFKTN